MSIDLEELFQQAGSHAPASGIDPDLVVRRGRRLRARRRAVAATTGLVAVGAVALGSVVAAGALQPRAAGPAGFATSAPTAAAPSATGGPTPSEPTPAAPTPTAPTVGRTTPSGEAPAPTRAGLRQVSLPDPAPGFPVRRAPDSVERMAVGPTPGESWVKTFLLAAAPAVETTDAAGNVSGTPTGPEATVFVGGMPEASPGADGMIAGRPVVATPTVAGVTGYVTAGGEKGTPVSTLYFTRGRLSVEVVGFGDVPVRRLVDLGDALTGLG
ncbi:MAG: hypothetical protein ACTHOK_18055 [Nocardioidaceae bacterium]